MAEERVQKKGWSDRLPLEISPESWDNIRRELAEASQAKGRVEGVVFMCSLDKHLELLLRTVMIDGECVDDLMTDGQALQPFSIKLRLAYALGLIAEVVRKDLYFLNKIRNAFAHKTDVTSFDKPPICDLCGNLSTVKGINGEAQPPREAHRMATFKSLVYLDSEIDRRAKKKPSLPVPPANFAESLVASYRDQRKGPTS